MNKLEFLEGFKSCLAAERGDGQGKDITLIKIDAKLSDILEDSLELYSLVIKMEEDFDMKVDFASLDGDKGSRTTVGDLYKSTLMK